MANNIYQQVYEFVLYMNELYNEPGEMAPNGDNYRIPTPKGRLLRDMIITLERYYDVRLSSSYIYIYFYMYMDLFGDEYFTPEESILAQEIMDKMMEIFETTSESDLYEIMRQEILEQLETLEHMTANPPPRHRTYITLTEEQHERSKENTRKQKYMYLNFLNDHIY